MSNDSNRALLLAISELREDVTSVEDGIKELEDSIPEFGTLEYRLHSNREGITGTALQIRMDEAYLKQLRGDLRRLERAAA